MPQIGRCTVTCEYWRTRAGKRSPVHRCPIRRLRLTLALVQTRLLTASVMPAKAEKRGEREPPVRQKNLLNKRQRLQLATEGLRNSRGVSNRDRKEWPRAAKKWIRLLRRQNHTNRSQVALYEDLEGGCKFSHDPSSAANPVSITPLLSSGDQQGTCFAAVRFFGSDLMPPF